MFPLGGAFSRVALVKLEPKQRWINSETTRGSTVLPRANTNVSGTLTFVVRSAKAFATITPAATDHRARGPRAIIVPEVRPAGGQQNAATR